LLFYKSGQLLDNDRMIKVAITCDDVTAALDSYTGELGFRVDSIFPADGPRRATLSGYGIEVELLGPGSATPTGAVCAPSLVVTKIGDGGFGTGRAGMQYRDLVPDRYGGHFIASHIRIPSGGPVPDYVHHHAIRFQLIFCVKGWVRVVYEDQGQPMLMKAGDCFLQPPHIRHRVLECSDGMEVVEIASPAEHETAVDHEMTLPTPTIDPDRNFGGQRFVFSQGEGAEWRPWTHPGFEYRDTGIGAATAGVASAHVVRARSGAGSAELAHEGAVRFVYVLTGSAVLDGESEHSLAAGDACAIPPNEPAILRDASPDFTMLEVCDPSQTPG
jgi:quercetin dioxygenase-like cupin family protein